MKRKRILLPHALICAFLICFGCGKSDWLADILRAYNHLTEQNFKYKPFHNQLYKWAFAKFMKALLELAIKKFSFDVIEPKPNEKLAMFKDIFVHDGSSFALKATLYKTFPGRFRKSSPAAVELHVTMSARKNQPTTITLAADKESEKHYRPDPKTIKDSLLLGDRGYQDRRYFKAIIEALGYYIIRGTKNIRPMILEAYDEMGNRIRRLEKKKLTPGKLRRQSLDLLIEWKDGSFIYKGRLIVHYRKGIRNRDEYQYIHTNLSREMFSISEIVNIYRFRWQAELLFKEWKSHANLHQFDTGKAPIAEGLIWASLFVATIKRAITHAAELTKHIELSTQRAASAARYYLIDVVKALFRGSMVHLVHILKSVFEYLTNNARRAHPNRDRKKGRFRSGLQSVATSYSSS
jgi:hypothetical protein